MTPGSCMSCDPTTNKCAPKCQALINTFYRSCEGVYTPPDYYFDPAKTIAGYWDDCLAKIRISVQRCGCNGAIPTSGFLHIIVGLFVTVIVLELD
ncbi:Aste57867_7302 [Aphanomyces stellatus]|nr:hypothetical protein As57867_007276 [Aphanomyces stellatus]VFT84221.1 Aste57867_7302 [Aphanomyces stellatus]